MNVRTEWLRALAVPLRPVPGIPAAVAAVVAAFLASGVVAPRVAVADPTACFTLDVNPLRCSHRPTFSAACTNPGGSQRSIVLYEWDLNGDGTFEQSGATMDAIQLGHDINSFAVVNYGLRVTDDHDATDVDTQAIGPQNRLPTAVHNGPYIGTELQDLTLDAAGSSSSDDACGDTITEYAWNVVEIGAAGSYEVTGTTASKTVPWSQINAWGLTYGQTYTLRLRTTDSKGGEKTADTTLVVYDKDPVPCFSLTIGGQAVTSAHCGELVTVDPGCSSHPHPSRAIVQWKWDWTSDGTYDLTDATGDPQTHGFAAFGATQVKLRVQDDAAAPVSATTTRTITIANRPPVAAPGGPYRTDVGVAVSFDGSTSSDPDTGCSDTIQTYAWDLDGDFATVEASGATPALSWATILPFVQTASPLTGLPKTNVRLRVTDSRGDTHTATTTLTVYDNKPTADFTVTPNPAECAQSVGFSAASSSHGAPDHNIISYAWDWNNDGVYDDFGATATHVFDQFGTYPVKLQVTDDNSPAKKATKTINVVVDQGNSAPAASTGGPYEIEENNGVTFDASGSADPDVACGDSIVEYAWDLTTDGTYDHVTASPTLTLTWAQVQGLARPTNPSTGTPVNNVTLRVKDSLGLTATATTTLAIYRNTPIALFTPTPSPAACGQTITFDGSTSYHGSVFHEITLWEWDWTSDGTYDATGASQPRIYPQFGTYDVTLRVTDNNSPPKSATRTVQVNVDQGNRSPIASAGGPYAIEENQGVSLDGSGSVEPDAACGDSIVKYEWDLNGDGVFEHDAGTSAAFFVGWASLQGLARPTNPQTDSPVHTIRLRVTDEFGVTQTATSQLRIYRNTPVALFTATPNPAQCNQGVQFDASTSYHGYPARAIQDYSWDFDEDGVEDANGVTTLRAFPAYGQYVAKLTVTDNNTPAKTATRTVTVDVSAGNQAPVPVHGGPYVSTIEAPLTLDASASTDPNSSCGDSIAQYEWDLNGDGVWDKSTTQPILTVSWADLVGLVAHPANPETGLPTNTVRLRIRDTFGTLATAQTTLTIYQDEPVAQFTMTPNPASCGATVSFDGTGSLHGDPNRTIVRWDWNLDGQAGFDATGPTTTRTYSQFGTYPITLLVTDDTSPTPKTATKTVTLNVNQGNRPPLAAIDGPYQIHQGDALTLSAAASSEPDVACGDSIARYELDLDGDGVYERSQTGPVFEIAWTEMADPARFAQPCNPATSTPTNTLALRVSDTFGSTSVVTTSLRIYDNTPDAQFSVDPNPAACGQAITLDASNAAHGSPFHAITEYAWDLEGTGAGPFLTTGRIISHVFASFGTFTVRLRVTDDNSPAKQDILSRDIVVNLGNRAPIASAGGPYRVDESFPVTLDASASRDPDESCGDSIVQYRWDLNSDGTAEVTTSQATYQVGWDVLQALAWPADPVTGTPRNTVTLRVTDEFGEVTSAVTTLTIYRNAPTALFTARPNPARCGQAITFDGTASRQESALHSLVDYAWDLDGDGTYDQHGPEATFERVVYAYPSYGSFDVTLKVTDDTPEAQVATVTHRVDVNIGNQAPVADPGGPYATSVGHGITLDASATTDPDTGCGDTITKYEWDLNGDGVYDHQATTPRLELLWNEISALAQPADPVTGQPYNTVTLRVTDSFSATDTGTTVLRIYRDQPVACATTAPTPASCGQPVTLDASCSYHGNPTYQLAEYAWDLDANGTYETTGQIVQHTFTEFGALTVGLRVRDNNTPPGQGTTTVTVDVSGGNVAPVAVTGGPYVLQEGASLVLDASGSSDPNAVCGDSIVEYAWDLDSNGTFERVTTAPTLPLAWATLTNLAHPADASTGLPTNPIQLRVKDSFGRTTIAGTTITIYDNTPKALASVTPNPARCGQTLTFSGAASYHGHPDRTLVSYDWDFDGNGSTDAQGAAVTHAYAAFGTYPAKLTVTDDNVPPKTATATVTVNVSQGNLAPVADPGGPYTTVVNRSVTLDASASADPDAGCGDRIAQYRWDIDADGVDDYTTTEAVLTVPWVRLSSLAYPADPDTGLPRNPVRLTVRDTFGLEHIDSTTLTIYADAPIACIEATTLTPSCGQSVALDAGCSSHQNPARSIVAYEWDLDDNGTYDATGVTLTHTFATAGVHLVRLRLTDNGNPARTATKTVTIEMADGATPPVADAGGPYRLEVGAGALLDASASTEADTGCGDRIVTYEWDLDGDGTFGGALDRTSTGAQIALTWPQLAAIYDYPADPATGEPNTEVSVRATDTTGRRDTASATLAIYQNEPIACFDREVLSGRCGLVYRFDATCSVQGHPAHEILHWRWTFGEPLPDPANPPADASVVEYQFQSYGPHTVKLSLSDDNDPPRTDILAIETIVRFVDTAPEAATGGPYVSRVGEDVALDASGSSDFDANCDDEIALYEWDLNGDGTFDVDGTGSVIVVPWEQVVELGLFQPADPESGEPSNDITLRVTDTHGLSSTSATTLTIYGTEPVACFEATPNPAGCGETVSFDGACAWHRDPDHAVVAWSWDLDGDGVDDAEGPTAERPYEQFGDYPVRLTVTDDSEPPQTAELTVIVRSTADNTAPVPVAGGPYAGTVGESLRLDGSASSEPNALCDDRIVEWAWDLGGDGVFEYTSATSAVLVPWSALQNLPAPANPTTGQPSTPLVLRVKDTLGVTATQQTTIALYDNHPVACFRATPDPARCGEDIVLDAACSAHGHVDHDVVSWGWDLDDDGAIDQTGRTATVRHDAFGRYPVRLVVGDDNTPSRLAEIRQDVVVSAGNRAPRAVSGGPYGFAMGAAITLDASDSFDPDGACGDRIALYAWDLDNDGLFDEASSPNPIVTVPASVLAGLTTPTDPVTGLPTYPIALRVTDTFGVPHTDATTLALYDDRPVACFEVNPAPATCGEPVTLDADCSSHRFPQRTLVRFQWDLDGDGSFDQEGRTVTHTFPQFATYRVRLRVTDDSGQSADTTVNVNVSEGNVAPVAEADGPYVVDVGGGVTLRAGGSVEPNAGCGDRIERYEWDLDRDGVYDFQSASPSLPVTWPQIQALGLAYPADPVSGLPRNTVTLRVTDRFEAQSTDDAQLTIYDNRPRAEFTFTPDPAGCGATVTFDGAPSSHGHPAHSLIRYVWNFGDGTPEAEGVQVLHAFPRFGMYSVRLRVTDDGNRSDDAVHTVSVSAGNRAPVSRALPADALVAGPVDGYEIDWGSDAPLDAGDSYDPDAACGDRISEYAWDYLGDNSFDVTEVDPERPVPWDLVQQLFGIECCHVPDSMDPNDEQNACLGNGCADPDTGEPNFVIRLRVRDTFGASDVGETRLVIYQNLPRACFVATPDPASCGEVVSFDADCSRHLHPGHEIRRYEWDFNGDGDFSDATGPVVSHAYEAFGVYDVALRVFDDNDPPRSDTFALSEFQGAGLSVSGGNSVPEAVAGGPYVLDSGQGVTLDGSGSSDPDVDCGDHIALYSWDLDGNGTFESSSSSPLLVRDWRQISAVLGAGTPDPTTGLLVWPAQTFTLRVTDTLGATADAQGILQVYTNRPVACLERLEGGDGCRDTFRFSAACSSHGRPDREIKKYLWDFENDGQWDSEGANPEVSHQFGGFGLFDVQVRVEDDNTPPQTAEATLRVDASGGNHAPVADTGGPYETFIARDLTLDASRSFDEDVSACADAIVTYEWDIDGDGSFDYVTDAPRFPLRWGDLTSLKYPANPEDGTPTNPIALRVRDRFGAERVAETTLTIYAEEPVACFTFAPETAACTDTVAFDGRCSRHTSPNFTIDRWEWDFDGDGTYDATGPLVDHKFGVNGVYDVQLRVTDDRTPAAQDGAVRTVSVSVGNQPPRADAGGPYTIGPGWEFELDGRNSVDPDSKTCGDTVVSWEWDLNGDDEFGDAVGDLVPLSWTDLEAMGVAELIQQAATDGQEYKFVLRVADLVGETATAEATVTYTTAAPIPDVVGDGSGGDATDGDATDGDTSDGGGGGGGCQSGGGGGAGALPIALLVFALLGLAIVRRRSGTARR